MEHDLNEQQGPYEPIDCAFHDELVSWATLQRPVEIVYKNQTGDQVTTQSRIADVFTKDGAEYVRLQNGEIIRLDMLTQVREI